MERCLGRFRTMNHIDTKPASRRRAEQGSTLLVCIVMAMVLAIVISSLLSMLTSEFRLTHRSIQYAEAFSLAEAGLEEGIAMVSYGNGNWASEGWSSSGSSYTKTVSNFASIASSQVIGTYAVTVDDPNGSNPTITGVGTVSGSTFSTPVIRSLKITLSGSSLFNWGLRAQGQISLNGNAKVDSFDSSNPSYSSYNYGLGYGTYTSSKRKDNGDVATNGGSSGIVNLNGNAGIYGNVNTGSSGTVTGNGNAFVGWLTNAPSGVIQSGRVSHTANMDFAAASVPFGSGISLGNYSLSGNGSATIAGGAGSTPVDYTASTFSISGNRSVTINGYVRIHVTGNMSTSGNGRIILSTGSKLEFYVAGTSSLSGNGVQNNAGTAEKFQLYSLNSSSVSISGNGDLTGIIYAPDSSVSISGNGDLVGAVVGNTISINGNGEIHYDEALKNVGGSNKKSVVSWQEL